MTRIIAGIAGSRQLVGPASPTRPTSDRIRESIFNRLETWDVLEGATVLDLYAGTGALALEAVSRGAGAAVMVEKDAKAAAVCTKNATLIQASLKAAKSAADTKVVNKSVEGFLALPQAQRFDLVFIDPPYEISNDEVAQNLEHLRAHLSADAVIVLERSSRSGEVALPAGYECEDAKNYGDTTVFWLSLAAN
ncbi:MAG: 16S rRNA (guanine(966)-N(2))-methyltransferase RsmD [Actinomycetales bacterium]|nr:16S rRNA (guanine(966)-N(2))-methyltransferase RsmD [Actinomycetales bacterium]